MIDKEAKAYTGEFREREFEGLKDSEIFFALATKSYVRGLLSPNHYIARQARTAIVLRKPVFIAFEKGVSKKWRRRVRAFFPHVDREMEWDKKDYKESLRRVAVAVGEFIRERHPGESFSLETFDPFGPKWRMRGKH